MFDSGLFHKQVDYSPAAVSFTVLSQTPQWGKFGHPSGQVGQRPIIQSNFCSWNCKGPRICNDINLTYGISKLVLRNTK